MAVTRIKNNQITDSTITYQKIASGTLVGSLFNPNLTLNSNISIVGNLQVSGNATTVNSIDTLITDPLVIFNNGYVGTPSYDVGILVNRNLQSIGNYGGKNAAWIWRESDGAFEGVLTTDTGTTTGAINRSFLANLTIGNITVANALTAERATVTTLNTTTLTASSFVASGNIVAASGVNATNYTTGALVVPGGGGVGITGDLWVQGPSTFAGNINAGNIQLSGNINVPVGGTLSSFGVFYGNAGGIGALYAGTTTYTALPTTVFQMTGNVNSYAQTNFQNLNSGSSATTDYILTADDGTDDSYYGDFGILGSNYNGSLYTSYTNGIGTVGFPNDTYLYAHGSHSAPGIGGNLLIGTSIPNTIIRAFVGGMNVANIVTTTTSSGLIVNAATASTNTTSGALIVSGGAGIAGNLYVGGTLFNAGGALGSFAAINNTPIGNATPSTGAFTTLTSTTETTTNFSTANAVITGGYIKSVANVFASDATIGNVNSTQGNVTTLVATNFSTGNARVTGGYADNFPIGANTASTGNFTTANATAVSAYTGDFTTVNVTTANITTANASTINSVTETVVTLNATTGNVTTLGAGTTTTTNLNTTNGNATTLVATNFSSGNSRITGGYADNFPVGANTAAPGNFTTANATTVSAYTVNSTTVNTTNANATTLVATNFSSGNAVISGGYISALTNAYITTSQITNFSTGNAQITGGKVTGLTGGTGSTTSATTQSLQVSSGGLGVVGDSYINGSLGLTGDVSGVNAKFVVLNATTGNLTNANATTLVATNFSTGNAVISDGYISALANITATNANFATAYATTLNSTSGNLTTLVSTNFSSGNSRITGGYADNFPIGANTKATGAFTTLTSNGLTTFTNATQSDNASTGAVVVTGGVGVGANLNVGGNVTVTGNLTVQGTTTTVNSQTLDVADINITVAKGAASAAAANGAGLTVDGANATITYASSDDSWNFNKKVNLSGINATSANITNGNVTTLYAQNFSTGNAIISGGNINLFTGNYPPLSTQGYITADKVQGVDGLFGNILIVGNIAASGTGYILGLTNFQSNIVNTANIFATFGNINGTTIGLTNPQDASFVNANVTNVLTALTGNINNINTTTANVINEQVTTLVATNFSSGNVVITGGYIQSVANVYATTGQIANFSTANALVTGGVLNNINVQANNFSTANALVTGGVLNNIDVQANNFSTANAVITGGYINNLANLTATTGQFTNFSTGNAWISGGNVTLTNAYVTTSQITNFSTGNAVITGGYINNLANLTATTGQFTNLSTANALVTGGVLNNVNIQANNISTSNAYVTNGTLNSVIIGNATPGYGKFTQLLATTSVDLSPTLGAATVTINPLSIGSIDNMNIGASYQGNAYVTNFRTTQSLWASTVGTVFIRAGTASGSSINNIVIGSTDPAAGTFTNLNSQTETTITLNAGAGNVTGALYAGSINTANAVISGGYITGMSNITATTGNVSSWYATNLNATNANITGALALSSLNTANAVISGGYITGLANANAIVGTFTTLNTSSANISGSATITGNIVISSGTTNPIGSYTDGALVLTGEGGAAIGGNVTVKGGMLINHSQSDAAGHNVIVQGVNDSTLLYVHPNATYDQVAVGGNMAGSTLTDGAKLAIYSTDAFLLPVGSSSQRPSGQGFTDVQGMIRYSTTTNQIEYYNGTSWSGTGSQLTLISDAQYSLSTGDIRGNVDGVNDTFVLPSSSTTNSSIVSINGVLQLPGIAYNVFSGNTSIVFTEAPAIGDAIDVRILSTTTTVDSISSQNGFNYFQANNTSLSFFTGNVLTGSLENWRIDTNGDFYPVTTSNIGASNHRVDYLFASNIDISGGTLTGVSLGGGSLDNTVIGGNIAALGGFTTLYSSTAFQANGSVLISSGNIQVDSPAGKFIAPSTTGSVASFDKTVDRGGEFLVSLSKTDNTEFQMAKVVIVHDGSTPHIEAYGVTFTGSANLATFSANISGSTVWLNASSAGANLQVKVSSTLIKV
jgi:hypothetical protein